MLDRIGFGMLVFLIIGLFVSPFNATIALEHENIQIEPAGSTGTSITQAVDWWPMFQHDIRNTGYSTSKAPKTNDILWNFTTADIFFVGSSPVVVDGKVYVGSWEHDSAFGRVYCLDASTGAKIWSFSTGFYVQSSPAVADGRVYVGSHDNKVYCLNATTGAHIWNYTTGYVVDSPPSVVNGRVYVGSMDRKVYCLNATTGAHIWNYTTGYYVHPCPAVVDGKVYVGSSDYKVYCLDALTGTHIWNYTTGYYVVSSSTVVDGKVYVGSCDRKVYCLDASTGAHIWNYTTIDLVHSSPAVVDGKVYVGSDTGMFYCLDASTGAHIWNYTTGTGDASPAVADGKVYVSSGVFYCLNSTTGAHIWSYTGDSFGYSSPAVACGKVYVGSVDGKVYAFGPPHDIALADVTVSKTVVCQNCSTSINVTVENQGKVSETFNITTYCNSIPTETRTVADLLPTERTTETFQWNTTGIPKGNYTISAIADIALGETDTTDNNFTDGWVIVSMLGDITGPDGWPDGKCEMRDIGLVARGFGANRINGEYWHPTPCDSCPHSPNCDVVYDGKIDMKDIGTIARHFGETDP